MEVSILELPHKFHNTEAVPGWCTRCGQHEYTLIHIEAQQKRIV